MKKKRQHPYSDKVKKQNRISHLDKDTFWVIEVTLMAFSISLALSFFSDTVISNTTVIISFIVLVFFIGFGIIFDMVGVAVTVADKKIFNSMAAKQVHGAKTALKLINMNSKVSSFCNDVVGDICGILSGSAGVTIAIAISGSSRINSMIINLVVTSLVAALTIGGKAIGKNFAINKANRILLAFSKFLNTITFKKF